MDSTETGFVSPTPLHDFLDSKSALYALLFERLSEFEAIRERFEAMKLLYPQIDVYSSDQIGILCRTPSPEQMKAWALMLALLDAWRKEVVENGDVPVLVLIPSQLQVSARTWSRVTAQYALPKERYDPSYPNKQLEIYGAARGLAVIDLLPAIRAEAEKGRSLYFKRDPHWNRYGHELAAERIASELLARGLVARQR